MNYDIVVVGSINMDVIVDVKKFHDYGHTQFAESIIMTPGGKGANQAVTAAQMDKKVCMVGKVGDDPAGNQVISNLHNYGVDTTYLLTTETEGTGTFVAMIDETGENTMVGTMGANEAITAKEIDNIFANIDSKILLVQMETSKDSIIASMKAAKKKGMYVILDPAPAEGIFEEAFQYCDLILPNNQETEQITDIKVNSYETAIDAAKQLNYRGVKDVIVKMGEKGLLVYKNQTPVFIESLPVKAVDTVGAGDCFAGALASALLNMDDLVEAARFANKAAGIKVSRTGGHQAIPTFTEVQNYTSK